MIKHYSHRCALIFFFTSAVYLGMMVTLYRIQIAHGGYYCSLGHQQYEVSITAYPPRAAILDRHGQPLALNRQALSAFVTPGRLADEVQLKEFLTLYYPSVLVRLKAKRDAGAFFIARNVSTEHAAQIKNANIKDIHFVYEPARYYPSPASAAVVGITDSDNKGISGLELQFNTHLAGVATTHHLWQDAHSGHYHCAELDETQSQALTPLVTTLDNTLQFLVTQEVLATMHQFGAQQGAALVIDPASGEILAMVSQPSFDPHNRQSITMEHMKNRTLTELYELGSVIKVCAALAALEEGVVQPDELIDCQGTSTAYINGRKVNTAPKTEAGLITFSRVIEKSNNIGIAQVALRLGEKLYDHYRRMGFDRPTGVEFPGERSGFINPPSSWSKQSVISLSYGYEVAITLAQLARVYCMIARDGMDVQLTLIRNNKVSQENKRLYSQKSIAIVRQILENTTLHGSTYRARIKGYTIMSKSGTANMLIDGQYTPDKGTYTCAGIIQKGSYQRVIIVFIKEVKDSGLFASQVAAPLFEHIAQKVLIHDKILL